MKAIDQYLYEDGYKIIIQTDVACHLWMRWTLVEPQEHPITVFRRGVAFRADKYFCFDVYEDNEQEEAGDTLLHTFIKSPWQHCETRYFYFHGSVAGVASKSTSPIFKKHRFIPQYEELLEHLEPPQPDLELQFAGYYGAQSFELVKLSLITRVAFYLRKMTDFNSGDLIYEIREDDADFPNGPVLWTGSLPLTAINHTDYGWHHKAVTDLILPSSTPLWLVMHMTPTDSMPLYWMMRKEINNPYPKGFSMSSIDGAVGWSPYPAAQDTCFRIYGIPQV